MVLTPSTMVELGTRAPDFALPATDGRQVDRAAFEGRPLLVAFICNHCPYVKHIADGFAAITKQIMDAGVAVVGINSNDAGAYPDDSFEAMKEEVDRRGYAFPYLYDETQQTARDFQAACTPDLFLYDAEPRLVYRGQLDDSRPGNGEPVTGKDLLAAVALMRDGKTLPDQRPAVGCNIKWRESAR